MQQFIRIKERMINLNLVSGIIYSEKDDLTIFYFEEENSLSIDGDCLEFVCQALGQQVLVKEDQE